MARTFLGWACSPVSTALANSAAGGSAYTGASSVEAANGAGTSADGWTTFADNVMTMSCIDCIWWRITSICCWSNASAEDATSGDALADEDASRGVGHRRGTTAGCAGGRGDTAADDARPVEDALDDVRWVDDAEVEAWRVDVTAAEDARPADAAAVDLRRVDDATEDARRVATAGRAEGAMVTEDATGDAATRCREMAKPSSAPAVCDGARRFQPLLLSILQPLDKLSSVQLSAKYNAYNSFSNWPEIDGTIWPKVSTQLTSMAQYGQRYRHKLGTIWPKVSTQAWHNMIKGIDKEW